MSHPNLTDVLKSILELCQLQQSYTEKATATLAASRQKISTQNPARQEAMAERCARADIELKKISDKINEHMLKIESDIKRVDSN